MCRDSRAQGFTLVEGLIASALVALAIGAWMGLQWTGGRTDAAQAREQETERLIASLQGRLARDLRSATAMETEPGGTITLRVLRGDGSGMPVEETVVYATREDGRVVDRRTEKEEDSYDFRAVLGERKLVFELRR